MVVIDCKDSWMIKVLVVQYFGLTGRGVDVVSNINTSPSWESFVD